MSPPTTASALQPALSRPHLRLVDRADALPQRPALRPGWRPLRRNDGAVQLGLSPDGAVVLHDLSPHDIRLLDHLDGSSDLTRVLAWAARMGLPRERTHALLECLHDAGALIDDADPRCPGSARLAARERQSVTVSGAGDLPRVLALALRHGGIAKTVTGVAAERQERALAHGAAAHQVSARRPHLAVLVARDVLDRRRAATWARLHVPVLPVVIHADSASVGPVVGLGGPCLECLDRHRSDRDPAWPQMALQCLPAGPTVRPTPTPAGLTALVAGVSASLVHAVLDGRGLPPGLAIDVTADEPDLTHYVWPPHPQCHHPR